MDLGMGGGNKGRQGLRNRKKIKKMKTYKD